MAWQLYQLSSGSVTLVVTGVTDLLTAWTKKHPGIRTHNNLDLTTAVAQRLAAVRASSANNDLNTQLRLFYGIGGQPY